MSNEKWEMICRDIAYLIKYIGQQVGINIEVYYEDSGYYNQLPHVYNKVIRKDGSSYYIDLYEDLYRIAMNMRTDYFGFKDSRIEKEFSRKQLEEMDYKFEYITRQKPYTDEYFYFLFNYISGLDSAKDGIEVVLENPSPYKNLDIGFYERKMYIFSLIKPYIRNHKDYEEIDWQWLDFYYRDDFNIIPKEIISIKDGSDRAFYEFDSKEGNYHQISEEDFGKMLTNGLCLSDVYKEWGYDEYRWIDDLQSKYSSKGK